MNSKGHLYISLGKSAIRIVGALASVLTKSVLPLAWGIAIAELGGIAEELVDER